MLGNKVRLCGLINFVQMCEAALVYLVDYSAKNFHGLV